MHTKFRSSILLFVLLTALTACQGRAEYDIRGTWEYTMIAADGITYDAGTMTFSGSPTRGTYVEVNIYGVEYEGEYRVNGAFLSLTGDESWEGTVADANLISGDWSHPDGVSGTFTAVRK